MFIVLLIICLQLDFYPFELYPSVKSLLSIHLNSTLLSLWQKGGAIARSQGFFFATILVNPLVDPIRSHVLQVFSLFWGSIVSDLALRKPIQICMTPLPSLVSHCRLIFYFSPVLAPVTAFRMKPMTQSLLLSWNPWPRSWLRRQKAWLASQGTVLAIFFINCDSVTTVWSVCVN